MLLHFIYYLLDHWSHLFYYIMFLDLERDCLFELRFILARRCCVHAGICLILLFFLFSCLHVSNLSQFQFSFLCNFFQLFLSQEIVFSATKFLNIWCSIVPFKCVLNVYQREILSILSINDNRVLESLCIWKSRPLARLILLPLLENEMGIVQRLFEIFEWNRLIISQLLTSSVPYLFDALWRVLLSLVERSSIPGVALHRAVVSTIRTLSGNRISLRVRE